MAEIVLMHPRVGDMDELRSSPALPLSLLHAASLVSSEFEVDIVDMRRGPGWREKLKEVTGPETLLVGVTAFTGPMILWNLEMVKEAKKHTDAPVVWGGIHATMEPRSTLADPACDIVVIGEGEETLLELARALKNNTPLEKIRGIAFMRDGEMVTTPSRELLDLETMPEIPYELVDVSGYMPTYMGRKSLYFQSSRGCPHACTYCYNPGFNRRKWRAQSAGKTLERLRHVVEKYGVEDVYFVDDNIFLDLERDKKLVEGIKELGITWQIQGVDVIRIKKLDDDFIESLRASGLLRLTIGVESGCPRIRKLMGKAGSVDDIKETFRRLSKHDIIVFANLLGGVPTETAEELKQTSDLMLELLEIHPGACNSPVYIYTPYPGTRMYELACREGFRPPQDLRGWGEVMHWEVWNWKKGGKKAKRLHEGLYFASNFLDHKARTYNAPLPVRVASDIYRPIAKWRVKHFRFEFMLEKRLADLAQFIMARKNG